MRTLYFPTQLLDEGEAFPPLLSRPLTICRPPHVRTSTFSAVFSCFPPFCPFLGPSVRPFARFLVFLGFPGLVSPCFSLFWPFCRFCPFPPFVRRPVRYLVYVATFAASGSPFPGFEPKWHLLTAGAMLSTGSLGDPACPGVSRPLFSSRGRGVRGVFPGLNPAEGPPCGPGALRLG